MVRSPSKKRPPRKSATVRLVWRGITCRVRHTPKYFGDSDHVEIEVVSPKGAPLPITTTGYRSHFLGADELADAGGPAAFVTAWLDREARSKDWSRTEFAWRQGDLFGREK
jgi:hypothetical protein